VFIHVHPWPCPPLAQVQVLEPVHNRLVIDSKRFTGISRPVPGYTVCGGPMSSVRRTISSRATGARSRPVTSAFTTLAAQSPIQPMHRSETRLQRNRQPGLAHLILMRPLQKRPPSENKKALSEAIFYPQPKQRQPLDPMTCEPSPGHPAATEPVASGGMGNGAATVEPALFAENIKLQNEPSPISGHLAVPEASQAHLLYPCSLRSG
jgi:hypothetical protein